MIQHETYTDPQTGAESGAYLPYDLADQQVHFAAGLKLAMDQIDRDPAGNLGMRTDERGNPALFRLGQIVTIQRWRGNNKPQYFDGEYLRDLTQDETGAVPLVVQQRLNWLAEVEAAARKADNAAQYPEGEVLGVRDEEILSPIARFGRLIKHLGTAGMRGRNSHHSPSGNRRPQQRADATGPGRHRDAFGSRNRQSAGKPGQHRR